MKKKSIGIYIIVSAIIWGVVIVGCSLKLKGTGYYDDISLTLFAGVVFHLLFVWTPLGIQFKQKQAE